MAERKERSQLLGDCLRDIAVLVVVFLPLEKYLRNELDSFIVLFVAVISVALLWWGMILEGRDEL